LLFGRAENEHLVEGESFSERVTAVVFSFSFLQQNAIFKTGFGIDGVDNARTTRLFSSSPKDF
jgi:hypothetical protein